MGINRDSRHKHRKTGGRRNIHQKKRKFERGRPCVMCHMGAKRVRTVRGRGGNTKYRALRQDTGNFAWGSECCTRKARIIDVVYNSSSNELVRTKTLCKNAIIQVDVQPFKQWYLRRYGVDLGHKSKNPKKEGDKKEGDKKEGDKKEGDKKEGDKKKGDKKEGDKKDDIEKACRHVLAKRKNRAAKQKLDPSIEEQFQTGRILVCISSRPGQTGRIDGYVLEG
uniref:40S ribosomal protein S8 n=1 Tax=Alexandrium fundyense TaxID=2932 RepID=A4UHA9_ALEFU|nr:40S ribosomal protein S8 [Alexandrium fundyense]